MPCTVWPPRFQRWFEKRFGDLCKTHDQQYVLRYHSKWAVDWWLVTRIAMRGHPFLAFGTWVFCSTVGWWYWLRK